MPPRQRSFINHRGRGRGAYYAAKYGNRSNRDNRDSDSQGSLGSSSFTHRSSYQQQHQQQSQQPNLQSSLSIGSAPYQHQQSQSYGSGTHRGGGDTPDPKNENGNLTELSRFLKSIDNTPYPNYKPLLGKWKLSNHIDLIFDQIQGDAYASPSRARLRVKLSDTGFPNFLYDTNIRKIAFCDYITRKFSKLSTIARLDYKRIGTNWSSVKGGNITIDIPSQHVISRTCCILDSNDTVLELRVFICLPAKGRSIEGTIADESITQILPVVSEKCLFSQSDDAEALSLHIRSVDEQEELRNKLKDFKLVAFIHENCILPRLSGNNDLPLNNDKVIKFRSPTSLLTEIKLSTGKKLRGLGIKEGITLIVGGGFHGKSTLLKALEVGIYNHVPNDGREFVCCIPECLNVRSEDGRFITGVDISPFINTLPFGKTTNNFHTENASGSTSQAANIIEGIDAGAKLLLIDEDLSATNFMMRDERMKKLVSKQKEPITPLIDRIKQLHEQRGVSCIMVVGGSGDYFDVSDTIIMMDSYCPMDVTEKAKRIAKDHSSSKKRGGAGKSPSGDESNVIVLGGNQNKDVFLHKKERKISSESLRWIMNSGKAKVFSRSMHSIEVGNEKIDLSAVSQLVETSQTKAIAAALERLSEMPELESKGITACIDKLTELIEHDGLDTLNVRGERMGNYSAPRLFELHAALNRLRGLQVLE